MSKENQTNYLTVESLRLPHILLMVLSIAMTGVSIYLVSHYNNAHFPEGLTPSALCNINSFFSCDAATYSAFSNIAGVPIALFGALFGAILLLTAIFPAKEVEAMNKLLAYANATFCALLLLLSLFVLKSLCPFCFIYYILSFIVAYLFYRYSPKMMFSPKVFSVYALVTLVIAGISFFSNKSKSEMLTKLAPSLISQYDSYPNLGAPDTDLPYRLASATPIFKDAPIQITIFSDFQCPACKMLSESMEPVLKKYAGKINVQYSFYPLDHNCNPKMTRPMHQSACYAAYLATCVKPEEFKKVHDEIFHEQDRLTNKLIDEMATKYGALDCVKDPKSKERLIEIVKGSERFTIESTPTMLVNGVKIEGVLPAPQLFIILDEILKRNVARN